MTLKVLLPVRSVSSVASSSAIPAWETNSVWMSTSKTGISMSVTGVSIPDSGESSRSNSDDGASMPSGFSMPDILIG